MSDAFEALIERFAGLVRSDTERQLGIHWSDVELLRSISAEQKDRERRMGVLRSRLAGLLDEAMGKAPLVG